MKMYLIIIQCHISVCSSLAAAAVGTHFILKSMCLSGEEPDLLRELAGEREPSAAPAQPSTRGPALPLGTGLGPAGPTAARAGRTATLHNRV